MSAPEHRPEKQVRASFLCRPSVFVIVAIAVLLQSCASLERLPGLSLAKSREITLYGIQDARFYPTDTDRIAAIAEQAYSRRKALRSTSTPVNFLAISGGADDGAFGAGLLLGWSAKGTKPEFDVVTGVSTGSLSAPFAFLGPEYDQQLKSVYTDTEANDIFQRRSVLAVVGQDAMADSAPLRRTIAAHVDTQFVKQLAAEYRKGRLLFILTTNLDQSRPVIWNIGAIAESEHPKARDLIIDVLLASSSMPGIFPPVMLDVSVDGNKFQEMHVDGGTIAQAFLYPPSFSLQRVVVRKSAAERQTILKRRRFAYIIRNGRLSRPEETVKLQTMAIAKEALATMIASSGVNDTFRMYLTTRRDGIDFNLAAIGEDFSLPYPGPFDRQYMNALFEYGYNKGRAGYSWQKVPPGYVETSPSASVHAGMIEHQGLNSR